MILNMKNYLSKQYLLFCVLWRPSQWMSAWWITHLTSFLRRCLSFMQSDLSFSEKEIRVIWIQIEEKSLDFLKMEIMKKWEWMQKAWIGSTGCLRVWVNCGVLWEREGARGKVRGDTCHWRGLSKWCGKRLRPRERDASWLAADGCFFCGSLLPSTEQFIAFSSLGHHHLTALQTHAVLLPDTSQQWHKDE